MIPNLWKKHVSSRLSAYCHGEVTRAEQRQIESHLESCLQCRNELEEIRLGITFANQLSAVSAPASLWPKILEAESESERDQKVFPVLRYGMVGLSLLLLIAGIWSLIPRRVVVRPIVQQGESIVESGSEPQLQASIPIVQDRRSPSPTPASDDSQTEKNLGATSVIKNDSGQSAWEVERISGMPRIGSEKIEGTGRLAVGESLETDNASSAKVKVAEIGFVDIEPNSKLRLIKSRETQHRVMLEKGKLSAMILAPPRLFIVDTPTVTAVDLGCAYTLEVDKNGDSLLEVTSGWVSFVRNGRESFIPAGAMCMTKRGKGLGTPFYADATEKFKIALRSIDFASKADLAKKIDDLLTEARPQDSLTLWHLLSRGFNNQTKSIRGEIFDSLVKLSPPPPEITRAGILRADQKMLNVWWEEKIR